jgi:hypothetical protein
MTAWEFKGFPKAFRWLVHLVAKLLEGLLALGLQTKEKSYLRHSSTMARCDRAAKPHITHRSWLKLLQKYGKVFAHFVYVETKANLSMTKIPDPSAHSVLPTGTLTSSNVIVAVPAVGE